MARDSKASTEDRVFYCRHCGWMFSVHDGQYVNEQGHHEGLCWDCGSRFEDERIGNR